MTTSAAPDDPPVSASPTLTVTTTQWFDPLTDAQLVLVLRSRLDDVHGFAGIGSEVDKTGIAVVVYAKAGTESSVREAIESLGAEIDSGRLAAVVLRTTSYDVYDVRRLGQAIDDALQQRLDLGTYSVIVGEFGLKVLTSTDGTEIGSVVTALQDQFGDEVPVEIVRGVEPSS